MRSLNVRDNRSNLALGFAILMLSVGWSSLEQAMGSSTVWVAGLVTLALAVNLQSRVGYPPPGAYAYFYAPCIGASLVMGEPLVHMLGAEGVLYALAGGVVTFLSAHEVGKMLAAGGGLSPSLCYALVLVLFLGWIGLVYTLAGNTPDEWTLALFWAGPLVSRRVDLHRRLANHLNRMKLAS